MDSGERKDFGKDAGGSRPVRQVEWTRVRVSDGPAGGDGPAKTRRLSCVTLS